MYSDPRRAKEATKALLRVQQPVQSCANGHLPEPPLTHSSGKRLRPRWILPSQNLSYLAGDHTDGPNWASWTHRQLGVMMHRMLPINRAYCRAEASQADRPDRDTGGGPAKRGSVRIKRSGNCVKSWCGKNGKAREAKQVCRPTMGKKREK